MPPAGFHGTTDYRTTRHTPLVSPARIPHHAPRLAPRTLHAAPHKVSLEPRLRHSFLTRHYGTTTRFRRSAGSRVTFSFRTRLRYASFLGYRTLRFTSTFRSFLFVGIFTTYGAFTVPAFHTAISNVLPHTVYRACIRRSFVAPFVRSISRQFFLYASLSCVAAFSASAERLGAFLTRLLYDACVFPHHEFPFLFSFPFAAPFTFAVTAGYLSVLPRIQHLAFSCLVVPGRSHCLAAPVSLSVHCWICCLPHTLTIRLVWFQLVFSIRARAGYAVFLSPRRAMRFMSRVALLPVVRNFPPLLRAPGTPFLSVGSC